MIIRFWGGIAQRAVLLAFCSLVVGFVVQSGETGTAASLVLISAFLVGCFTALQTFTALIGYVTLRETMRGKK